MVVVAVTAIRLGVQSQRQAFRIPTTSMEPTLLLGDYIYVDKGAAPKRDDVLVFRYPQDPTVDYVGAGRFDPPDQSSFDTFGPLVVSKGHLFMLGDNRDRSSDSRVWGFLDETLVRGRVTHVYWSWDPLQKSIRWCRIGTKVD